MPRLTGPTSGVVHPDWENSNRPAATSGLTSVCTITRAGTVGTGVFDRSTGITTGPAVTTVASGVRCNIERTRERESELEVAEQQVTVRRYELQVPHDTVTLAINDLVEITASRNGSLVGRVFRVTEETAVSRMWTRMHRVEVNEG